MERQVPDPERDPRFDEPNQTNKPDSRDLLKHGGLFLLTFVTVALTGILWVGQTANADSFLDMLPEGILFASVFLLFLASHEFGHYFAALYHGVRVTLPYFIPVPFGIGTLGAVIRIKEKVESSIKLFDIGIAGPIAGFVISILTLLYGFSTLPEPTFIHNFEHHEEVSRFVDEHGTWPEAAPEQEDGMLMMLGNTLLFSFLSNLFTDVPPMWELYHYPFLFAGWLGLFFTALNLMPVGQLDGGHILYSLIGFRKHRLVARLVFTVITIFAGIEAIPFFHELFTSWSKTLYPFSFAAWGLVLLFLLRKAFHQDNSWVFPVLTLSLTISAVYLMLGAAGMNQTGSLIWVFWAFFLTYFTGLEHPPALVEQELTPVRKFLGWLSMAIFILCISPNPIYFLN